MTIYLKAFPNWPKHHRNVDSVIISCALLSHSQCSENKKLSGRLRYACVNCSRTLPGLESKNHMKNHPIQSLGEETVWKNWHVVFFLRIALILKSALSTTLNSEAIQSRGEGRHTHGTVNTYIHGKTMRKEQPCYTSEGTHRYSSHSHSLGESWYQALFAPRWGRGHSVRLL